MNVGVFQSQSRKKRMVNHRPSPLWAVLQIWHLVFCCLFFFWYEYLLIFTTWTNSWPISSAFTSCNFKCMSCYIRRCLCLHIPPIQSSSKYIRRIIPKSWFCSTSLWIRQAVCSSTQYSMICFLYLLVYWEGSLLGKCLAYSLHAHFMPHLQNCFLSVFVFILKNTILKANLFESSFF